MSKKLTYTKKKIRTTISEIQTLDKAYHICIIDFDLRDGIILKMADKFESMVRIILKERKLQDWIVEEFTETLEEMNKHIKEEDYEKSIFFDEAYELSANIRAGLIKLNVLLDLNMNL